MQKIDRIEVKRAFVLSQVFTSKRMRTKSVRKNMIAPSQESLKKNLLQQKKRVLCMSEKSLDKVIGDENKKRLKLYNELEWYIDEISINHVKVWKGTGGLYASWTERCSLAETAKKLKSELKKTNSRIRRVRAFTVVPQISDVQDLLKKEKYLMPIVVPNGSYKRQFGGIKSIEWFLDDGCMRSLAYAVSGDKKIKVFIGECAE